MISIRDLPDPPSPPRKNRLQGDWFRNPPLFWRQLAVGMTLALLGGMAGLILTLFISRSALAALAIVGAVAGFIAGFWLENS